MKKTVFVIAITLIAVIVAGSSVIETFTVTSQGDQAVIEWVSGVEGNLLKYKVERSEDNKSFTSIQEVYPQGNYSNYVYIDDNIMKLTSQRIYYYRIKMIFADGSFDVSDVKSVTLTFSGLQETWGSIKAMFR
ncbi:MAG: hypothetical protein H8E46_03485 [FCB group bacterium]|nr:hypothetical protein [FCB group bacterium]